MLAPANRLKKTSDFEKVYKKGRVVSSNFIRVRYLATCKNNPIRIGFVVSNKVDKRAAKRNAIKRRLRAISRSLISELKSGYDVIVFFQGKAEENVDFNVLEKNLVEAYKKAGLFQNKI